MFGFFFFYSLAFSSSPVAVKGTRCIEPGEHYYFNSLFEPLPNALQYLLCLWLVFGSSGWEDGRLCQSTALGIETRHTPSTFYYLLLLLSCSWYMCTTVWAAPAHVFPLVKQSFDDASEKYCTLLLTHGFHVAGISCAGISQSHRIILIGRDL